MKYVYVRTTHGAVRMPATYIHKRIAIHKSFPDLKTWTITESETGHAVKTGFRTRADAKEWATPERIEQAIKTANVLLDAEKIKPVVFYYEK